MFLCFVSLFVFSVFSLCCRLVVSTSAIDCMYRLVTEMTYYESSGTLNPTHSLTHSNFGDFARWVTKTRNSSGDEIPERDIALFCYPLRLTPSTEGFPWDDLRKILHEGQRMTKAHSGKNTAVSVNPLSRAHERYR